MSRGVLLFLGFLCVCGGLALSALWYGQDDKSTTAAENDEKAPMPAILVAARPIGAGFMIQREDVHWREVPDGAPTASALNRGQISESELVGTITRRSFAANEPLLLDDIVRPEDRKFLAAILEPGKRAVAVPIEAQQSVSGLILPGDHVDVILAHTLVEEPGVSGGFVAETILHNVRIIAVDQMLSPTQKPATDTLQVSDAKMPRAVTVEVDEAQAQVLSVALQLGKLQFALRSLQQAPQAAIQRAGPTFATDVSPALREISLKSRQVHTSASSIESSIRRPPGISN